MGVSSYRGLEKSGVKFKRSKSRETTFGSSYREVREVRETGKTTVCD